MERKDITWRRTGVLASALALILVLQPAVAALGGGGGVGESGPALAFSGGPTKGLRAVTSTSFITTSSTTFATIPGASITFTIPSGERGTIVAQFSAESDCDGDLSISECRVRLMITDDGVTTEMHPRGTTSSIFDSVGAEGGLSAKALSTARVANVTSGTITVFAEWSTTSPTATFILNERMLKVERWA